MTIKNGFLFILIITWTYNVLVSQPHFINYSIQDGLPAENVLCAVEDHDGFMWFGTSAGVCMFDGINFQNISSIGSGDYPGGVFVTAIEVDVYNNLWIGTEKQGIYHYDRAQSLWTHFAVKNSGFLQLRSNEIFCFHSSDDGLMWYGGSNSGLGCININREEHFNYDMNHLPKKNTWQNRIYDIAPIANDFSKFYVVGQGYLYIFDKLKLSFEAPNFSNEPIVGDLYEFAPHSIVTVSDSEVWVGTWNSGIKSFDLNTGMFNNIYPSENRAVMNWRSNVHKGRSGEVWITHRQEGIGRFILDKGELEFYTSEPFNRNGLIKGNYNSIYVSSQDHTWVLTSQGISLLVPEYQAFTYYQIDTEKTNFFLDIDQLPDSGVYLGSFAGEHAPLKVMDKELNVLNKSYFWYPKETFQSVFETEIYRDKILCRSAELLEYKIEDNRLVPFNIPGYSFQGGINDLLTIDEDLWLLMGNGSLVKYNDINKEVKEYHFGGYKDLSLDKVIYHGMVAQNNNIWIATHSEIIRFDLSLELFRYFYIDDNKIIERDKETPIQYSGILIEQILPIQDKMAWVLSPGEGLYQIDESKSGQLSVIAHKDKSILPQLQSAVEIISGTDNDYWLATRNGLVHADSAFQNFKVYGQNEGLRNGKLSQGLERIGQSLFIGMPKGFAKVDIPTLLVENQKAQIIISKVINGDIEVLHNETNIFSHSENNFTVHVASPIYHEAKSVDYQSRLIGQKEEWISSNAYEQVFRYQNLMPGKYTFEVKAISPGTDWSDVKTYSFIINPPFWKTTWFKILTGSILGLIGYWIYKWKLKNDLKDERIKTRLASLESQALRARMNPHFIFNSLNSIKSLIQLDRKQEGVTYLTKFSKMVREILQLSKEKFIPLRKELDLLNIYLEMEGLRFQERFNYCISIDPSVNIYSQLIPPLLIQPYAENSIWHGLLHLERDALLKISLHNKDEFLVIVVEDNGIGRKASELAKSRNLIYSKKSEGLELNKNRIDLISEFAQVNIEDLTENGVASGTRVTIKLPINYG